MAKKFDPKAKAKRQKIVAGVLAAVFVAVLAYQVPTLMKSKSANAPASPPPTPAAVSPATPTTPAPGAASASPVAAAATTPATLVDSDAAPQPGSGQLISFGRFASKDPFAQQLGAKQPAVAAPRTASTKKRVKALELPEDVVVAPPQPSGEPATVPTAAKLSVNGARQTIAVGATFPQADPVFKLVSVESAGTDSAKIAIAGGSYASGRATLTLTQGKAVTLMNTADGTRYKVTLVAAA